MFVTLSTYFYVGARMLLYSRKDVIYTNADNHYLGLRFAKVQGINGVHEVFYLLFGYWLLSIERGARNRYLIERAVLL